MNRYIPKYIFTYRFVSYSIYGRRDQILHEKAKKGESPQTPHAYE